MLEENKMNSYDIIIIGAGAAGISAAIYAKRAGRKVAIIERMLIGGQLNFVGKIVNYTGVAQTDGISLSQELAKQVEALNLEIIYEEVVDFQFDGKDKKIVCKNNVYHAKAVILAMGGNPKELEIDGEKEFKGRGVSYCVQCDGNFFKGRNVAVVGSSQAAIDGALYLGELCQKVYLISRFDVQNFSLDKLKQHDNINLLENALPKQILGDEQVTNIVVSQDDKELSLNVDGVFVVAGNKPNTAALKGKVDLTEDGFIICNEAMQTSEEGVYACGDVRNSRLKQVATAVGDGAIAGVEASLYVQNAL